MNKLIVFFISLLSMQFTVCASGHKSIEFNQLPEKSQQFIEEHFPGQSIALIKIDKERFYKTYEVIFSNGTKVEFDRKGSWTDVESRSGHFPVTILPVQIRNYISENFPDNQIFKAEKENRKTIEIELKNGIELTFDSKFRLIHIEY